jgi:UDPglucose--hexose-1-phosphate uridylyltransferase
VKIEIEQTKKTAASSESELRQDIVTGDWVVIAVGRAKRPEDFISASRAEDDPAVEDPFLDLRASGQEEPVLLYTKPDGDWSLAVIPNKFPAFTRGRAPRDLSEGPYFAMSGVGYHEVIITRDQRKSIAELELWQVAEVVDAYHDRYLSLMNKKSVNAIQIFHNHGREAGASIAHPHSQLMAIPVVSPYLELELRGAELYHRNNRENVYQTIVNHESKQGDRVVFENEHFLVFCPFASRAAFEISILPKSDNPYFERITDDEKLALAEALRKALLSIWKGLGNPAYNFYLHTAPCDGKDYPRYRWHFEILPRTSIWGGFELANGIEVSTIQPEKAAEFLRSQLS